MATVELLNVCKTFGDVTAVDNVNLSIPDGEFMVFVGPSGCGKSTTLRMIAGLEDTSSGTVMIGGRDVTHLQPKDRNVAMVFQNYALYAHKNVYDNLGFGLKVRGVAKGEIDSHVQRAAKMLGLEELLERKPKQLSGGQKQRVALGRALVRDPDLFLLDEPLSNLDAKMRVKTREEIAKLHAATGSSMIYVTHDQVEAMTLGDRIAVMSGGRVQQVGPPLELYDHPANVFVGSFIGSPEMNLVDGELVSGASGLDFMGEGMTLPLGPEIAAGGTAGQTVTAGLRPEHLNISDAAGGSFAVEVDLIEQMGAQTLILCKLGKSRMRALVTRNDTVRVGEILHLQVQPENVHVFDKKSEISLKRKQ
ncbi:MAG: ABC transporter ATP-binding protein [Roseovarius sp.]